jgi:hypothetical protein
MKKPCDFCGGASVLYVQPNGPSGLTSKCPECEDGTYTVLCDGLLCTEEAVTNLDGDNLCQHHADEWARAEGQAAAEASFNEDHSPVDTRTSGSVKRSHRAEGRNWVD